MYHPIYDDPGVRIDRWEHMQAQRAGVSVEQFRAGLAATLHSASPPGGTERPGFSTYKYEPVDLWPLAGVLAFAVAGYFTFRYAWVGLVAVWTQLPELAGSPVGSIAIGVVVLAVGGFLFQVRERHRPVYAGMELSSAFGVAVEACSRLHQESARFTLLFQLLAATYIAVRGFDNLKTYLVSRRKSA